MRYYATAEQHLVKQQIKQRILRVAARGTRPNGVPAIHPLFLGQPTPHKVREESPEILVEIGSGGNNKCKKGILEQKYKDNTHEISAFSN